MPNIKLSQIVCLLAILTVTHFTATAAGLYEQPIVWIDKVLHIMAGVTMAVSWLWIVRRALKISLENVPAAITIGATVGFVLLMALLWEIFEFAYWKGAPEWANKFKFYSPTIVDVLGDLAANVIGGAAFSIFVSRKKQ